MGALPFRFGLEMRFRAVSIFPLREIEAAQRFRQGWCNAASADAM
jgi:hypothetical protein